MQLTSVAHTRLHVILCSVFGLLIISEEENFKDFDDFIKILSGLIEMYQIKTLIVTDHVRRWIMARTMEKLQLERQMNASLELIEPKN